jgi:ribosomal protein L27
MGRDHTLYAGATGRVEFGVKGLESRRIVSVIAD